MAILVTGGAGFIASNLVIYLLENFPNCNVVNLDCMSYNSRAPDIDAKYSGRYTFVQKNLCDPDLLKVLTDYNIDYVYHLAAQTHVDLSFRNSVHFSRDNVVGTHNLLEAVCKYGKVKRFLHMSTDEVYGQVFNNCDENSLMNPTNPYAATKCGAEFLVRSYGHSFKLNYVIARGNNVYGPRQYPDKLIPKFSMQMFAGTVCKIQGDGEALRHFVHVSDVAKALKTMMDKGTTGQVYNIANSSEFSVKQVYNMLYDIIKPTYSKKDGVKFVADRPFNDMRYDISDKALRDLGWAPEMSWKDGIESTVAWYRKNGATYWANVQKWLIYGSKGWIGQKYCEFARKPSIAGKVQIVCGEARANDADAVVREMDRVRPSHVVCIIGRTHGPGCGTIDWLEQDGHLRHNVRDNLYAPVLLAMECKKRNIHCTYMGTGCIFKYDGKDQTFTEEDKPNFFGSSYSIVKGFTDQMMKQFEDTVLNCRIRMPISCDRSGRNFITKITTYEKVCSIPNSMTVLEELLPMMIDMARNNVTGTFNMTNPGKISHNEILQMYKEIVDPKFTWKNFSHEEMLKILAADRSNNELINDKLKKLYPEVRGIHEAVRDTMKLMKEGDIKTGRKRKHSDNGVTNGHAVKAQK